MVDCDCKIIFNFVIITNSSCHCLYFFREVSVDDPSWSELKHFVSFLNEQLKCSELSVFCNKDFVHDTLSGFKTFVVRFMILMSKASNHYSINNACSSVVIFRNFARLLSKEKLHLKLVRV